jgi:hypothetical protein
MTAVDALWHLLNAVAAPFGLAFLSVGLCWWMGWPQGVRRSVFGHLIAAYAASSLAYLGTWLWQGTEGTMSGYGMMVAACALAIWVRTLVGR